MPSHVLALGIVGAEQLGAAVDHDADRVAGQVTRADRRVASQVPDANGGLARPEPEAAAEEVAVDWSNPWLAARGHGPDDEVLHPGEVGHDLAGSQPPLRRDDEGRVPTEALGGSVEDRLQLGDLLLGLVHGGQLTRAGGQGFEPWRDLRP